MISSPIRYLGDIHPMPIADSNLATIYGEGVTVIYDVSTPETLAAYRAQFNQLINKLKGLSGKGESELSRLSDLVTKVGTDAFHPAETLAGALFYHDFKAAFEKYALLLSFYSDNVDKTKQIVDRLLEELDVCAPGILSHKRAGLEMFESKDSVEVILASHRDRLIMDRAVKHSGAIGRTGVDVHIPNHIAKALKGYGFHHYNLTPGDVHANLGQTYISDELMGGYVTWMFDEEYVPSKVIDYLVGEIDEKIGAFFSEHSLANAILAEGEPPFPDDCDRAKVIAILPKESKPEYAISPEDGAKFFDGILPGFFAALVMPADPGNYSCPYFVRPSKSLIMSHIIEHFLAALQEPSCPGLWRARELATGATEAGANKFYLVKDGFAFEVVNAASRIDAKQNFLIQKSTENGVVSYEKKEFTRATLDLLLLSGVKDFSGLDFSKFDLRGCNLDGCDLRGCVVKGAIFDKDVRCEGAFLGENVFKELLRSGVKSFRRCDLRHYDLTNCDLRGCDLSDCDLRSCRLEGAIFDKNTRCEGATFYPSVFKLLLKSDVKNFSRCNFSRYNLSDFNLSGCDLRGCALPSSITIAQIESWKDCNLKDVVNLPLSGTEKNYHRFKRGNFKDTMAALLFDYIKPIVAGIKLFLESTVDSEFETFFLQRMVSCVGIYNPAGELAQRIEYAKKSQGDVVSVAATGAATTDAFRYGMGVESAALTIAGTAASGLRA